MPNSRKRMAYFSYESDKQNTFSFFSDSKCKDEVHFSSQTKRVDAAMYPFKLFTKSNKCKKIPGYFVETFKNYPSCIHTFSLTDNWWREKKRKNLP